MPVFEVIIHFEEMDMNSNGFCGFVKELLRDNYGIGKLPGYPAVDVKIYFFSPQSADMRLRHLREKIAKVLRLAEKYGLRYKSYSISSWCNASPEACEEWREVLRHIESELL